MGAVLLGELPALPLHTAGRYVAGAYVVLFAIVLIYVAIMGIRLSRIERELGELLSLAQNAEEQPPPGARDGDGDGDGDAAQPESTLA
jgi:hypothetical protein